MLSAVRPRNEGVVVQRLRSQCGILAEDCSRALPGGVREGESGEQIYIWPELYTPAYYHEIIEQLTDLSVLSTRILVRLSINT